MDAIDKINVALAKKGLTGADLSRMIGVSSGVYSQWNTRATKPSNKSLSKIAQALDVDVSELLPDTSAKKEPVAVSNELSEEEKQFILWYRNQASEKDKAIVKAIVEAEDK